MKGLGTDTFSHGFDPVCKVLIGQAVFVNKYRQQPVCYAPKFPDTAHINELAPAHTLVIRVSPARRIEQCQPFHPLRRQPHNHLGDVATHRQSGEGELIGGFRKNLSCQGLDGFAGGDIGNSNLRDIGEMACLM